MKERTDAVEEILTSQSTLISKLKVVLTGTPDLVKGLCRVQYGKVCRPSFLCRVLLNWSQCSPKELASLLMAYDRIAKAFPPFDSPSAVGFDSSILNDIIYSLPSLLEPVGRLLHVFDIPKARAGEKKDMWLDPTKFPQIQDLKEVGSGPLWNNYR